MIAVWVMTVYYVHSIVYVQTEYETKEACDKAAIEYSVKVNDLPGKAMCTLFKRPK